MPHAWKQTIDINENIARELINSQHHITIETIILLDEGWDNLVYLVNGNIIFRFPRRELGVICMQNEILLLPYIAKQVSFKFSVPHWVGQPSDLYPYPFSGYNMLSGESLCDAATTLINNNSFILTLASWLKELHSIPVNNDYVKSIKGNQEWRFDVNHRVMRCEQNINQYEEYFLQAGFQRQTIFDVIEFIRSLKFKNLKKSFLHGDLYSRHIIVSPQTLMPVGLIDWGDVHVGHPGIDLAVGMIFDDEAFRIFLETYNEIDDETITIMLFHAFCHSMSFLPYAYEQNKESLMRWGRMTLNRSIIEIIKLQDRKKLY